MAGLLEEANHILSIVKVECYSLEGVDTTRFFGAEHRDDADESQEKLRSTFDALQEKLMATCRPLRRYRFDRDNVVITIQVNGLIVAACVLVLNNDAPKVYYDISTICSIGTKKLREYLIMEAEKYARLQGVHLLRAFAPSIKSVKFTSIRDVNDTFIDIVRFYHELGYNVQRTGDFSSRGTDTITHLAADISEEYTKVLEADPDSESSSDSDSHHAVLYIPPKPKKYVGSTTLVHLVLGLNKRSLTPELLSLLGDDRLMKKWSAVLEESGLFEQLHKKGVYMWKDVSIADSNHPRSYTRRSNYSKSGSLLPSTHSLPIDTDKLLDLFHTRIRTLTQFNGDEIISTDSNGFDARLDVRSACRGVIEPGFIDKMIDGYIEDHCPTYVVTISFSGRILSFALFAIKHTSRVGLAYGGTCLGPDPSSKYMNVRLLCAKESTGLGSHMMRYIEDFAVRLDLEFITLESVLEAVDFYVSKGFSIGCMREFEQPDRPNAVTEQNLIHMTKRVKQASNNITPHT